MDIFEKNLLLLKQKENQFYGIQKGFEFLDSFLDRCEKLEQNKNSKSIEVFDYRINKISYFDPIELQYCLDIFYVDFLYQKYFSGYISYEKLRNSILAIIKRFDLSANSETIFVNFIIRNLLHFFYSFEENKFSKDSFHESLKIALIQIFNDSESLKIFNLIFNELQENKVLIQYDNFLKLSDDYFFLHLKIMSLNAIKIYPDNLGDIEYGCIYGFNNLINVIFNFFATGNIILFYQLLSRVSSKSERDYLYFFYKNYYNLDAYAQELKSFDSDSIELNKLIYFDRLVINSYCFHVISSLCFKKHYFNKNPNIILDKNPILRLNFF